MNKDKISSQEIIDLVATKASVSKRAAEEFLKVMIATIEDALLAGDVVKIKNFGTFKLQWNEPRKSVNVQTGEDILIEGYHKVSFTPDTLLKELVNKPFAHLEPVQLDGNIESKDETKVEDIPEPLRIFTEQASEIKNLISEINALSPVLNTEVLIEEIEDTQDAIIVEDEELKMDEIQDDEEDVEFLQNEEEVAENEVLEEKLIDDNISDQPENTYTNIPEIIESETQQEPIPTNIETPDVKFEDSEEVNVPRIRNKRKAPRKRNKWLRILLIFLFVSFGATVLYILYPPATVFGDKSIAGLESVYVNVRDDFSVADIYNKIKKKVLPTPDKSSITETIIVPKDSTDLDSLNVISTKDSLQILFDTPRVYPEFIASEQISRGSRLARMSERYYGTSDFWVYIYEANMDRFDDPDKIPSGALIHIPKLDPRLIDASNPRCINKAKELHDLYVK